jgi:hypothetical protein
MFTFNTKNIERESFNASDKIVVKDTVVREFDSISVAGSFRLRYEQTDSLPHVKISASDNIIPLIELKQTGNNVSINYHLKRHEFINVGEILIYVYTRSLRSVSISGSCDFAMNNGIITDSLSIDGSGSSHVRINGANCRFFSYSHSGSGDLSVNGLTCPVFNASVSGSGDINVKRLDGGSVNLSVAGSGDVKLDGKADNVEISIAGSGDVDIDNLKASHILKNVNGNSVEIKSHK